ncbi:hydroxyacid dehydrogenase [Candidatus Woesearchaeota archaeon]|nr:hydroxyacid dehydrogenase [Candidatus Woesearchaeota archaeon]
MATIAFYELEKFGLGDKKDYLREHLKGHDLQFIEEPLTEKTAIPKASIVAFFIYSKINDAILKKLSNVKLITTMSTGYDHVDIEACKKKNITACNVPAYGENTVAEHAMALLLSISRNILPAVERTRKGNFELEGLRGFDLKGKTLGILGTGRIGRHVAHYAQAFDMRVIAWDKFPNEELAKECGFTYVPFEQLLSESDAISIHLPETPETHHIINTKNIRTIKKGCVLINTARGGIVETEALLIGLKERILKACGLDVLEEECAIKEEAQLLHETFQKTCDLKTLLEEHILLEQPNVLITPHNAFNSTEALMRILDTTIDNIQAFVAGVPKNKIN